LADVGARDKAAAGALIAGSALPRSTFSTMPSGTPGLSALTGGLSTVMTPIPSTFSKRTNPPSAMSISSLQRPAAVQTIPRNAGILA
jgi:hypothetical protein